MTWLVTYGSRAILVQAASAEEAQRVVRDRVDPPIERWRDGRLIGHFVRQSSLGDFQARPATDADRRTFEQALAKAPA